MSNSRQRYLDLIDSSNIASTPKKVRQLTTTLQIIRAANKIGMIEELLTKVEQLSSNWPTNSEVNAAIFFEIAAEELKVDELCNK